MQVLNKPYTITKSGIRVEVGSVKEVLDMFKNNAELFCDFEVTKGKMDDVFLNVTGKKLEGGN